MAAMLESRACSRVKVSWNLPLECESLYECEYGFRDLNPLLYWLYPSRPPFLWCPYPDPPPDWKGPAEKGRLDPAAIVLLLLDVDAEAAFPLDTLLDFGLHKSTKFPDADFSVFTKSWNSLGKSSPVVQSAKIFWVFSRFSNLHPSLTLPTAAAMMWRRRYHETFCTVCATNVAAFCSWSNIAFRSSICPP